MDGFAVRRADFEGGEALLLEAGESRAGRPFAGTGVPPGSCVAIYTGAQVPDDCDAVVVVEKSERQGERVLLTDAPGEGQNICNRGEDLAAGEVVLAPGRRLTAADLSVLAAVGCDPVRVHRRPVASILTTGDELVPPTERPGPGQIREGNTLHLAALAERAGARVARVGLVRDERAELQKAFGRALEESDVVITTGGVSVGRYDLVAEAFRDLEVEEVFHKVAIKPGKPLWFGRRGRTLVFGLPGNPVSCLVGHEIFVRPALRRLEGEEVDAVRAVPRLGRWEGAPSPTSPREQYRPVTVRQDSEGIDLLTPLEWRSSADIVGLTRATAMAVIPPGERIRPGELVAYHSLF